MNAAAKTPMKCGNGMTSVYVPDGTPQLTKNDQNVDDDLLGSFSTMKVSIGGGVTKRNADTLTIEGSPVLGEGGVNKRLDTNPTPIKMNMNGDQTCASIDEGRASLKMLTSPLSISDERNRLLVICSASEEHDTGDHQENALRTALLCGPNGCLRRREVNDRIKWIDSDNLTPAPLVDLLRVHEYTYLKHLEDKCRGGYVTSSSAGGIPPSLPSFYAPAGLLDADTPLQPQSLEAAKRFCGAAILAVDHVMTAYHHASSSSRAGAAAAGGVPAAADVTDHNHSAPAKNVNGGAFSVAPSLPAPVSMENKENHQSVPAAAAGVSVDGSSTGITGNANGTGNAHSNGKAQSSACITDGIINNSMCRRAFVLGRPPGHHAGPHGCVPSGYYWQRPDMTSSGFCLLNTVAVAAAYARHQYGRTVWRNAAMRRNPVTVTSSAGYSSRSSTVPSTYIPPPIPPPSSGSSNACTHSSTSTTGTTSSSNSGGDGGSAPTAVPAASTNSINEPAVSVPIEPQQLHDRAPRIAIVDIDIHHGNGTEEIVRNLVPHQMSLPLPSSWAPMSVLSYKPWLNEQDSEEVFFSSVHLYAAQRFYPCSGPDSISSSSSSSASSSNRNRTCSAAGVQQNIVNIALTPIGPGPWDAKARMRLSQTQRDLLCKQASAEFRSKISTMLLPQLQLFKPDLIFISAGFDAHFDDMYHFLTEQDLHWVTEQLCAVGDECGSAGVISVLEGGYSLSSPLPKAKSTGTSATTGTGVLASSGSIGARSATKATTATSSLATTTSTSSSRSSSTGGGGGMEGEVESTTPPLADAATTTAAAAAVAVPVMGRGGRSKMKKAGKLGGPSDYNAMLNGKAVDRKSNNTQPKQQSPPATTSTIPAVLSTESLADLATGASSLAESASPANSTPGTVTTSVTSATVHFAVDEQNPNIFPPVAPTSTIVPPPVAAVTPKNMFAQRPGDGGLVKGVLAHTAALVGCKAWYEPAGAAAAVQP